MSNNEKYVFRLYNIGSPTEYANEHFGQDMSGKLYLGSPYMGGYNGVDDIENYKELGEEIVADDKNARENSDYLSRRSKLIDGYDGHNGRLYLPHRGISVIGLHDPRFSFYEDHHMYDKLMEYDNNLNPVFNKRFISAFDKKTQEELLDRLNEYTGTKLSSFDDDLSNIDPIVLRELMHNSNRTAFDILGSHLYTDDKNFSAKDFNALSNYDFGYKDRIGSGYEQLLRRIAGTQKDTKSTGLALATVPESALYSVKDVIDGKLRAQRDYPEELVVRSLVPQRMFDTEYSDSDLNDKTSLVRKAGLTGDYASLLSAVDELDKLRMAGKSVDYTENWAKDYINRTFEIDPDQIHSDETKKIIFDDLSNWYKGYCDKKKTEHSNILSGIKELGQ